MVRILVAVEPMVLVWVAHFVPTGIAYCGCGSVYERPL